jgi:hypothetical protein
MVKTDDAIRQKVFDLGLKVGVKEKKIRLFCGKSAIFFSSQLVLSVDLPTVLEALKILAP